MMMSETERYAPMCLDSRSSNPLRPCLLQKGHGPPHTSQFTLWSGEQAIWYWWHPHDQEAWLAREGAA